MTWTFCYLLKRSSEIVVMRVFVLLWGQLTTVGGVSAVPVADEGLLRSLKHLLCHLAFEFPFIILSFEFCNARLSPWTKIHLMCLYRPPLNTTNKLTDKRFLSEFHDLLDHCKMLSSIPAIIEDFSVRFDKKKNCRQKGSRICSVSSPSNLNNHLSGA